MIVAGQRTYDYKHRELFVYGLGGDVLLDFDREIRYHPGQNLTRFCITSIVGLCGLQSNAECSRFVHTLLSQTR